MAATNNEPQSVFSLIEKAALAHPAGSLLESFVTDALNPVLAARYVKERLLIGEASSLVADWSYIVESSEPTAFFIQSHHSDSHSHS